MVKVGLPPKAIAFLEKGHKIAAIKATHDATGWGLKEAKEAVEAYDSGRRTPTLERAVVGEGQLPPLAIEYLRQDKVIEAVKATREATGLGLKDAKEAVDAFRNRKGPPEGAQVSELRPFSVADPAMAHETGARTRWLVPLFLLLAAATAYLAAR